MAAFQPQFKALPTAVCGCLFRTQTASDSPQKQTCKAIPKKDFHPLHMQRRIMLAAAQSQALVALSPNPCFLEATTNNRCTYLAREDLESPSHAPPFPKDWVRARERGGFFFPPPHPTLCRETRSLQLSRRLGKFDLLTSYCSNVTVHLTFFWE